MYGRLSEPGLTHAMACTTTAADDNLGSTSAESVAGAPVSTCSLSHARRGILAPSGALDPGAGSSIFRTADLRGTAACCALTVAVPLLPNATPARADPRWSGTAARVPSSLSACMSSSARSFVADVDSLRPWHAYSKASHPGGQGKILSQPASRILGIRNPGVWQTGPYSRACSPCAR